MRPKDALLSKIALLLTVTLLAGLRPAYANEGRLFLSPQTLTVPPNQTSTIEVWVEEMPSVYGVEIYFTFDPDMVEITALEHGDFLTDDPNNEAFILLNGLQGKAKVGYALVLLNPAPAAQGQGKLLDITFRPKGEGQTTILLSDVLFGTRKGEMVEPFVDNDMIQVDIASAPPPEPQATTLPPAEVAPLFSPPNNQPAAEPPDTPARPVFDETILRVTLVVLGGLVMLGGVIWLLYFRK